MSADLPVDPAMVNARVTVTIETDATATSPATRTTVTMPRVEQVHATPLMQIVDRPSTILMPPGQLSAMVLRFDLAPGLAQVQMHTARVGTKAGPAPREDLSTPTVCVHCGRSVMTWHGEWLHTYSARRRCSPGS